MNNPTFFAVTSMPANLQCEQGRSSKGARVQSINPDPID